MAISKCQKCEKSLFEMQDIQVQNSNYKLYSVQCSSCGTVLSIMSYFDAGVLAKENQENIASLKSQIDNIEYTLTQIQQYLKRL